MRERLIKALMRQFHQPRGVVGHLAGWVMGHRSSNRQRNKWVVSLLEVKPSDRVLEIGFGPGVAILELSRHIGDEGHVYGVDPSDVMVRQATKRNAAGIAAGRVSLIRASVEQLPAFDEPLDAVMAVNTFGLWPQPAERLGELHRLLRPGGTIAIAIQPRHPDATAQTTHDSAREIVDRLREAGFAETRVEILPLDPPVACVLAQAGSER
jgi:ubiquinone/menaquinone biosynthesis C-methylase UbiE